jgi:hypothetical protein
MLWHCTSQIRHGIARHKNLTSSSSSSSSWCRPHGLFRFNMPPQNLLFSVLWFTVELSSNKNVLQKRYQRLVEWDGDRTVVFWSTITAIICINPREGLLRPPSQMFRRWGLRPITLDKGPPYLWPLEKGWSSYYKAPRHWAPCWSTDP